MYSSRRIQGLFIVTYQHWPVGGYAQEAGNRGEFPAWLSGSFAEADSYLQFGSLQEKNIG